MTTYQLTLTPHYPATILARVHVLALWGVLAIITWLDDRTLEDRWAFEISEGIMPDEGWHWWECAWYYLRHGNGWELVAEW